MPSHDNRRLCRIGRWTLLIVFWLVGATCLSWAFQSADFSVPADPFMSEIYKTKAVLLLPISLLFFAVGVLFFICVRCAPAQRDSG
jgi:hypothetical protein